MTTFIFLQAVQTELAGDATRMVPQHGPLAPREEAESTFGRRGGCPYSGTDSKEPVDTACRGMVAAKLPALRCPE